MLEDSGQTVPSQPAPEPIEIGATYRSAQDLLTTMLLEVTSNCVVSYTDICLDASCLLGCVSLHPCALSCLTRSMRHPSLLLKASVFFCPHCQATQKICGDTQVASSFPS